MKAADWDGAIKAGAASFLVSRSDLPIGDKEEREKQRKPKKNSDEKPKITVNFSFGGWMQR